MTILDSKKAIRHEMISCRKALTENEWRTKSSFIIERVKNLDSVKSARVIHTFVSDSIRREVNTIPLIEWMLTSQKTVLVPCIENGELISVEVTSLDKFVRNSFGILEPIEREQSRHETEIDIVVVPLLAVDHAGNRVGYGKGYYDRFLRKMQQMNFPPLTIGVAFEFQVLASVPFTIYDTRISTIVSDLGSTICR